MAARLRTFILLALWGLAYETAARNLLKPLPEANLAKVIQNLQVAVEETLQVEMNFEVFVPTEQIGTTIIEATPLMPGPEDFQMTVTAIQNLTACDGIPTSCPEPELVVWVFASINYKTYTYSTTVTGKTLALGIGLVGGLNIYPQNSELTTSGPYTTSVTANFLFNPANGYPSVLRTVDTASKIFLEIQYNTTIVTSTSPSPCVTTPPTPPISTTSTPPMSTTSTPPMSSTPAPTTPQPNSPLFININTQVFVPNAQNNTTTIVSAPLGFKEGHFLWTVSAMTNEIICSDPVTACPDPELIVWVNAAAGYTTYTYSQRVTGQALWLIVELDGGLNVYPRVPEFTASAEGTVSVNVILIYNPNNGLPSFSASGDDSEYMILNVQTLINAFNCTTTTTPIPPTTTLPTTTSTLFGGSPLPITTTTPMPISYAVQFMDAMIRSPRRAATPPTTTHSGGSSLLNHGPPGGLISLLLLLLVPLLN